jgi:hypothetical protein
MASSHAQRLSTIHSTLNVEPGIDIAGYGEVHDCDMVAVTGHGYEQLSAFQLAVDDSCISPGCS